jgi:hypothetical protein
MTKAFNLLVMAAITVAAYLVALHGAEAADSLPQAMLGTWCTQEGDEARGMKRCAPDTPHAITMRPWAMVNATDRGRCRVVSVTTLSATRWLVNVVCNDQPDRTYGWTFFRAGERLYRAQVGTYTGTVEEKPYRVGDDALGCFTRTYDRAHLARHPDQLVTAVKLDIYRAPPARHVWFDAQFKLRGKDKPLRTSGRCDAEASDRLYCSVDCDGGGVDVVPRAHAAMMYLDRIRMAACGEDYVDSAGQELTGGKDDRVFRLDRVDAAACAGMKPKSIEP